MNERNPGIRVSLCEYDSRSVRAEQLVDRRRLGESLQHLGFPAVKAEALLDAQIADDIGYVDLFRTCRRFSD